MKDIFYKNSLIKNVFLGAMFLLTSCNTTSDSNPNNNNGDFDETPPVIDQLTAELAQTDAQTFTFTVEARDNEIESNELSFTWDFGEGTVREGSNSETFSYEANQTATVKVTVEDNSKNATTESLSISTHDLNGTLDPGSTLQTIEGFGGFGAAKVYWADPPLFNDPEFVDLVVNDLGLTILRDNIPTGFEFENDNNNPDDLDLSAFNLNENVEDQDAPLGTHFEYLTAMREAGVDKFITSVWSPPAWMKECNCVNAEEAGAPDASETDHKLKRENYEEFAEYCVAYINVLKENTGIDLYAISLQNEPAFKQPFASSVYNPDDLRDLIKVVGKRFEDEGIDTKIFAPEDVKFFQRIKKYLDAIVEDDSARSFVDIFAIHNYSTDGVTPGKQGPDNWISTREIADENQKQVWMTETSGFEADWDGALKYAQSIYNAVKFGEANAWVYWSLASTDPKFRLIEEGTNLKTLFYHISKHYYKYIRPGAHQISSNTSNNDVLILGFRHPDNNTDTIIMINNSNEWKPIELQQGSKPTVYEGMRSTETEQDLSIGEVDISGPVLLPSKSITTLYAQ